MYPREERRGEEGGANKKAELVHHKL